MALLGTTNELGQKPGQANKACSPSAHGSRHHREIPELLLP